jgi:hypothetical protein
MDFLGFIFVRFNTKNKNPGAKVIWVLGIYGDVRSYKVRKLLDAQGYTCVCFFILYSNWLYEIMWSQRQGEFEGEKIILRNHREIAKCRLMLTKALGPEAAQQGGVRHLPSPSPDLIRREIRDILTTVKHTVAEALHKKDSCFKHTQKKTNK